MNIDWKAALSEIEKTAWVMPAINAALTISGAVGEAKENMAKTRLTRPGDDSQYRLQSPYAYQFEGGKHLSTKPVIGLNTASSF